MNQVRQSWRYRHEDEREGYGFYDGSIWKRSQSQGDEALKALIREGVKNTSVTCVLAGTSTFQRRWVRYEIARSIIKGNGLLTVKIHGLADRSGYGSYEGPNPLDYMAVYRGRDGSLLLAEWQNGMWVTYRDYTWAIELPAGWEQPGSNVIPLSHYGRLYDYVTANGSGNFAAWIATAAMEAGR